MAAAAGLVAGEVGAFFGACRERRAAGFADGVGECDQVVGGGRRG
jgi:hypothetical protein